MTVFLQSVVVRTQLSLTLSSELSVFSVSQMAGAQLPLDSSRQTLPCFCGNQPRQTNIRRPLLCVHMCMLWRTELPVDRRIVWLRIDDCKNVQNWSSKRDHSLVKRIVISLLAEDATYDQRHLITQAKKRCAHTKGGIHGVSDIIRLNFTVHHLLENGLRYR